MFLERKILFGLTLAVSKQIRNDLERTAARKIPCLQSVCRYRKDGIYQYVKQQPENVLIILEENLQGASPYTAEEIQQLTDLGNNRIIFLMTGAITGMNLCMPFIAAAYMMQSISTRFLRTA